ncbi:hypothetical protein J2T12_003963 [Paenibacillus anaericanus]|uniref:hypothetical protein n=1 Tax=Paenibacillus anaericanus TaxID=170367 RepID=UPI00277E1541|nr:hypothetical protein [Paenibacillus anaericanus]MDQ0090540.1 hypothetical protein [Paenibacillus anaericanus]
MDKRVLSSLERNIRGKKRATLTDDRQPDEIKQYNIVTIHQLYSQFMEIKRSEGISDKQKVFY